MYNECGVRFQPCLFIVMVNSSYTNRCFWVFPDFSPNHDTTRRQTCWQQWRYCGIRYNYGVYVLMYICMLCLRGHSRDMLRMPSQFSTVIFQKRCVHMSLYTDTYTPMSSTHCFVAGFVTSCTVGGSLWADTGGTGDGTPGAWLSGQCPAWSKECRVAIKCSTCEITDLSRPGRKKLLWSIPEKQILQKVRKLAHVMSMWFFILPN